MEVYQLKTTCYTAHDFFLMRKWRRWYIDFVIQHRTALERKPAKCQEMKPHYKRLERSEHAARRDSAHLCHTAPPSPSTLCPGTGHAAAPAEEEEEEGVEEGVEEEEGGGGGGEGGEEDECSKESPRR